MCAAVAAPPRAVANGGLADRHPSDGDRERAGPAPPGWAGARVAPAPFSGAGSGGQQAGAGVGAAPFCIIEDGSIINNFDSLSGDELNTNIESRRNEIFRLMEEGTGASPPARATARKPLRPSVAPRARERPGGAGGHAPRPALARPPDRSRQTQQQRQLTPGALLLRSARRGNSTRATAGAPAVRRLRVQQKIRQTQENGSDESDLLSFASAIPLFPDLTGADKLDDYYKIFGALIIALIFFGGIVAPTLEVYLGVGGTSYEEVIQQLHLPSQLAQVDPIVASFTGGAVGVLSALPSRECVSKFQ